MVLPNRTINYSTRFRDPTMINSGWMNQGMPAGAIRTKRVSADSKRTGANADSSGIPDIVKQRREQIADILDPSNVLNDSALARSESALTALMDQGGPLSEEVQNLIAGRMSDSTAAAADSQRQLLREQIARTGGSLNDPSVQAQTRAIEASRMGQNATGRRDVAIQAALENFSAKQGLADQLRGLGATRQGLANPLRSQWANLIAQYTDEDPNNQQGLSVVPRSPGIPQSTYRPRSVNQRGAPSVSAANVTPTSDQASDQASASTPSGPPLAGASQGNGPIVRPGEITLSMPTQAWSGGSAISERQEAPRRTGGISNMEALNQASRLRKSTSFRNRSG